MDAMSECWFYTHGHEVMHAPTALWSKGPLSQCPQKVCHVDGLQRVLTHSFLKLVAERCSCNSLEEIYA